MKELHVDAVIIGGGQAGLAMGYYLAQQKRDFIILDAGERIGEGWRKRWDSLRLFTPAALSSLPGLPFPAAGGYFPSKDEMAAYLETYAQTFELPIRLNQKVETLARDPGGYLVTTRLETYRANQVVVATGPYHTPYTPSLATQLDSNIAQLHSKDYQSPAQLPEGDVLVVGAGNSGAEIAKNLAPTHHVYLSGRDTGSVPGIPNKPQLSSGALLGWRVGWWLLGHVTSDTKLGQKAKRFSRHQGAPLIRLKPNDLIKAGVERVTRTEQVVNGQPALGDGRVLNVQSIIWATGFKPNFAWIKLPIFDENGYPLHHRGVVEAVPGLYFLGLPFLHTFKSAVVGGVGEDARYLALRVKCCFSKQVAYTHSPY